MVSVSWWFFCSLSDSKSQVIYYSILADLNNVLDSMVSSCPPPDYVPVLRWVYWAQQLQLVSLSCSLVFWVFWVFFFSFLARPRYTSISTFFFLFYPGVSRHNRVNNSACSLFYWLSLSLVEIKCLVCILKSLKDFYVSILKDGF